MKVVKRNGRKAPLKFDKIHKRVEKQTYGLSPVVDSWAVAKKVIEGVYDGVTTVELDELATVTAAHKIAEHPDYGMLAARIAISRLHKTTKKNFSEVMADLYNAVSPETGEPTPAISDRLYELSQKHAEVLDEAVVFDRDYAFDYFGFLTLRRAYLLKAGDEVAECPQYMYMRVALALYGDDLDKVVETYDLISQGMFTFASPTMYNAGTPYQQMSSCFLTEPQDSLTSIYENVTECAEISKRAGGIGVSLSRLRAAGAFIKGTGGRSTGIIPVCKVYEQVARHVNQGGKRKGSIAAYLEPWHADFMDFIQLRKNHGDVTRRAYDLFLAVWANNLFFQRVDDDGDWSFFSPDEAPGLVDSYGEEFVKLYEKYEQEGLARKTMKARDVLMAIEVSRLEAGMPYILNKDEANKKSNQKHSGIIVSSNLCAEILEVSNAKETAVCNLASIPVNAYLEDGVINYKKLQEVVKKVVQGLNHVLDENAYPVEKARTSNVTHRPIGIGVQGLANLFMEMKLPFTSPAAREINKALFEHMYYAAVEASVELAKEKGMYETFPGSPASEGKLQFDLWGLKDEDLLLDWTELKAQVVEHGMRNSLLMALMPTASTSQILGNYEAFYPAASNMFTRDTLAGRFVVVNRHLVEELEPLGLWTEETRRHLMENRGSIQGLASIPQEIKDVYRTVFETSQKQLMTMSAERGPFICQTQSLNLFIDNPNVAKLASSTMHGWKLGLKTIAYYVRMPPASGADKKLGLGVTTKTAPMSALGAIKLEATSQVACAVDDEECLACGA